MLIVDASAVLRALLSGGDRELTERLGAERELHAPHLIDLEITSALRRLVRARQIGADRARDVLTDLIELNISRYPHLPLLPRIWQIAGQPDGR